ncbi:hypothetical protein BMF94_1779 [Rhodotorula taiwanensis]|uniref:DUF300-domain-containing protein n=1 Tax=Rhodotorula taiwanensis TaxID=741276 RepID=A0A2S5BEE5_9BASI|nr:hypothetical protein BMF94_1779 [Rhodotorula taiwanensis]
MGGNYTSTGCPVIETLPHDPTRFLGGGDLNWQLHNTGWLVCGCLTVLATATSTWLVSRHLSYFYHPKEQRHVVRLLFMPVIYSTCSFGSYYFTRQAIYWQLLRDCYEAVVIGSFFFLLTSFLSNPPPTPETPHPQPHTTRFERAAQLRLSVKDVHLKKWMWPLGKWKWRPAGGGAGEGEAFLWWMRVCIGQYILVRPLSTVAAVIGQSLGFVVSAIRARLDVDRYHCVGDDCDVLYMPLKDVLAPHQPVLKFLCVKLVVFFMFWQETLLSFFPTFGIIKSSAFWTAEDITIGLAALLACFEMVIFSVLHIKAFPYQPYRALAPSDGTAASQQRSTYRKTRRPRALLTVLNFADFGREIVEEIRFLCRGGRPGDELLEERRRDDFEAIMGQSRPRVKARTSDVQEELAKLDRLAAQGNLPVPLALLRRRNAGILATGKGSNRIGHRRRARRGATLCIRFTPKVAGTPICAPV